MLATGRSLWAPIVILLLMLSMAVGYVVSTYGDKAGYLTILSVLGIALSLCFLAFPRFGFYFTIIYSFVVTDIARFIGGGVSLSSTVDPLILATFAGVLIQKVSKRDYVGKYCNHPIVYAYIIYATYTLLQIFNPNLETTGRMFVIIRKFLILLTFYYSTLQLFNTRKEIVRFFKIFLTMAFITGLYACYQQWFGMPQYELNFILSDPLLVGLYRMDDGGFRKFSFMADPKGFGLLMAAVSIAVVILALNIKMKMKKRLLLLGAAILLMVAMSYSGTRTATFMLVMGLVLYVMLTIANRTTLIFTCIGALGFLFILYGPIYGNVTINRIRSTFDLKTDASLKVRDINRKNIQPYMHAHPFGGGLGTTGILNIKDNPTHPLSGFPTDSGFLQVALEAGWIGLIIQCVVYFLIIQQAIRAYFRSKSRINRPFFLVAAAVVFAYSVAQYAQVAIGAPPGIFLFYGLIATVIRLSQMEKEKEEKVRRCAKTQL